MTDITANAGQGKEGQADAPVTAQERPDLLIGLGLIAIGGCLIFTLSILIADFVVPHHDWVADTISDLGAGELEWIVDIGIYSFSAALLACATGAAHVHLGRHGWTFGIYGLIVTALVVFLIGARNEYGDQDQDGAVIHIYLVYALGGLFAAIPWAMSAGARRAGEGYGRACLWASWLWIVSAPVFFMLPTSIDGIYERYLGLLTFVYVCALGLLFIRRGLAKRG
ncbi:DUF998 domain-containing protein [Aestuariibius sp. 2305UL40-4]|uniref:DUF998 domain-containing protein n=1 Tax=Aestuariibius violaceus TaxID=3234132 RepID=UPI00345EE47B